MRGTHNWEVQRHRACHTCPNDIILFTNIYLMKKYIAREIWDVMSEKLRFTPIEIQGRIAKDYGIEISYLEAWQVKQQALINLFRTWKDSFAKLPHLIEALVDASQETVIRWDTEKIDGEYIKSNFNTKVKDSFLKEKFGKVAYAKKEYKFAAEYKELMEVLKDKPDVRMWLCNQDPEFWSLALHNSGMRWANMTNKAPESFSDVLKHGRDLPISALVLFSFKQVNAYFNKRRYYYDNTNSAFPPKVHQSHAMAACKFARVEFSNIVALEYILQAYNMTWSYHFTPLVHKDFWDPYEGLPHVPNSDFKLGKVSRIRQSEGVMSQRDVGQFSTQGGASSSQLPSRIQRCKNCHQTGHNRGNFPNCTKLKIDLQLYTIF
ncbi:hypothetical protein QQ045_000368 [Rhodiola kirilowii]